MRSSDACNDLRAPKAASKLFSIQSKQALSSPRCALLFVTRGVEECVTEVGLNGGRGAADPYGKVVIRAAEEAVRLSQLCGLPLAIHSSSPIPARTPSLKLLYLLGAVSPKRWRMFQLVVASCTSWPSGRHRRSGRGSFSLWGSVLQLVVSHMTEYILPQSIGPSESR